MSVPTTEILLGLTNLLLVPTVAYLWTIGGRLAKMEGQMDILLKHFIRETER